MMGRQQLARAWSLVFYGWWNVAFVPLLIGSITFNFLLGRLLGRSPSKHLPLLGRAALRRAP